MSTNLIIGSNERMGSEMPMGGITLLLKVNLALLLFPTHRLCRISLARNQRGDSP